MPKLDLPAQADTDAEPSTRELRQHDARREVTERRRMIQRLRQALATGGFILHYQAIVNLRTGFARGAEALLRLRHSRRGFIPAQHFLPIAERSELLSSIAGWALREACQQASSWPAHFTVSLPLSLPHLQSGQLIRQLLEALHHSNLAAERLELEVTEPALLDSNEDTVFALKALPALGVRLALNNFGARHASLSALRRLPFTTLRLDRSLVQNVEDEAGRAIIRAAIETGHALGQAVLADGVETETQYQILLDLGADEGQGPYFSPPMAAEDIATMFAAG
jgi:EAL domain-containing protein (putative c-di-GMP-specific phosphodiesterase class I)